MEKPLVSVITPCYNGEKFLNRYFESILSQTYSNIELIFINDGSMDRTEEIVLAYTEELRDKGIRYIYEYQENQGQAAALNRGLKLFSGDYLTWPDSDDVMKPECIEKKVDFLLKNQSYQMVRSNGICYSESTGGKKRICDFEKAKNEDIFHELLVVATYGCCGCYLIAADLFKKIYPDRNIMISRYGQNWQVLVPASSYTRCGYIDEDLYIVYEHDDSHSRKDNNPLVNIDRWEGFTEIVIDAINRSNCDREVCRKRVLENCAKNQFYFAIDSRNIMLMRKFYCKMKQNGGASLKNTLLYTKVMCSSKFAEIVRTIRGGKDN